MSAITLEVAPSGSATVETATAAPLSHAMAAIERNDRRDMGMWRSTVGRRGYCHPFPAICQLQSASRFEMGNRLN
jgi:hypothetical protein